MANGRTRVSFPRLDGLRALCFLSVFFTHGFYTENPAIIADPVRHFFKAFLFASGDLGVNVFFVLSGFLITFLLLREREITGTLNVPHFWMRRILRIWPLYFACVAFGFLVFPWIKSAMGQVPDEQANPWYYALFIGNFDVLYHGLPDSSCLAVLWSIAVEEQFYVAWPLLLFILPPRTYPYLFAGIIVGSAGFNLWAADDRVTFFHTLSCMGDLAMGALGALLLSRAAGLRWVAGLPAGFVIAVHVGFLSLYLARVPLSAAGVHDGLLRVAIALSAVLVVLCQAAWPGRACMMPDWSLLSYLGRISYGLYCLHPIGILTAVQLMRMAHMDDRAWQVVFLQPAIALLVTILIAAASYHFYESPFLRLKSRFAKIQR